MSTALATTALHALHLELGARMVPFAGYDMPVSYPAGIIAEHRHCRDSAALFDVSHMGQLRLIGDDAARALESLVPMDVADLAVGKQRYAFFTNSAGGILDDLMITRRDNDLFLIVNAACKAADIKHLVTNIGHRCTVQPLPDRSLLALQGPKAVQALARLNSEVGTLTFMTGRSFMLVGAECFVTRSGYTGEDGFELYLAPDAAPALWRALAETGAGSGLVPAGLASRDTLRLEAGMPLYGHELGLTTFPVQAGIGRVVNLKKTGDFVGRTAVETGPADGARVLVGLRADGKRAGRADYLVLDADGTEVGVITSGALSPTLGYPIAMAYVNPAVRELGTELFLDVRGTRVPASVTALPFYQRKAN